MKFRFSMGHLALLTMLAAGTVTSPAAAEEHASEPPTASDAKTAAPDSVPETGAKSRDAKTSSAKPKIDSSTEEVRNGSQIRVEPKDEALAPEGQKSAPCEQNCDDKLPARSGSSVPTPIATQEPLSEKLRTRPALHTNEPESSQQRLGHALGIGGIVAAALGTYLTAGAIVARDGTPSQIIAGRNGFFFAGLACIGIGGGLMIGGFSLAAAPPSPTTAVDRVPTVATRRSPTDMGVSLSGSF